MHMLCTHLLLKGNAVQLSMTFFAVISTEIKEHFPDLLTSPSGKEAPPRLALASPGA